MNKEDKEKIVKNLSGLVANTRWNDELEAKLMEHKVFSQNLIDKVLKVRVKKRMMTHRSKSMIINPISLSE